MRRTRHRGLGKRDVKTEEILSESSAETLLK